MKPNPLDSKFVLEGRCAGPSICPLSRVEPGTTVCIKQLTATPEMTSRLRELGFCEQQKVKLLTRDSNIICQVCNARLGISQKVADAILVEPVMTTSVPAGSTVCLEP